jgi:hypothetical protein
MTEWWEVRVKIGEHWACIQYKDAINGELRDSAEYATVEDALVFARRVNDRAGKEAIVVHCTRIL